MTFSVTLTFRFVLPLEMSGFLEPLAYILVTIRMKTCIPCIFRAWTFYIGLNGHVPDEYIPDVIKKNWIYLNHTISILWWHAKLHYHSASSFRVICKKPFHKIRQRTVQELVKCSTQDKRGTTKEHLLLLTLCAKSLIIIFTERSKGLIVTDVLLKIFWSQIYFESSRIL